MPLYDYECQNDQCKKIFEGYKPLAQSDDPCECPSCKSEGKKIVSTRQTQPTFTERLYPFYHTGIGEVVTSEANLKQKCTELGFMSKHEGARMTAKQERWLMSKREAARPREIVQKATWSGRGMHSPTFEIGNSQD